MCPARTTVAVEHGKIVGPCGDFDSLFPAGNQRFPYINAIPVSGKRLAHDLVRMAPGDRRSKVRFEVFGVVLGDVRFQRRGSASRSHAARRADRSQSALAIESVQSVCLMLGRPAGRCRCPRSPCPTFLRRTRAASCGHRVRVDVHGVPRSGRPPDGLRSCLCLKLRKSSDSGRISSTSGCKSVNRSRFWRLTHAHSALQSLKSAQCRHLVAIMQTSGCQMLATSLHIRAGL